MICPGLSQPFLFLFSSDVPQLLYYSHIPAAITSLLLGFLIFRFGDKKKSSLILLFLTINFFLLFITNIILWTNIDVNILTFFWFISQFIFLLLPILSFYLFYIFSKKDEVLPYFYKILGLIAVAIFLPIILFGYNIDYFDLYNCEVIEGKWIAFYQNSILILSSLWMMVLAIKKIVSKKEERNEKKKTILLALGLCSMLFSLFFSWNPAIFGYSFGAEQFGFIGMIIFLSVISYLIVQFKAFNVKLIATQALVWGITILTGSQLFFIKIPINFILTSITFIGVIISGRFLIKSVKKEVEQKEELEKLTTYLEEANEKLKSFDILKSKFLSLASHQLRNPISAIISCTSMFLGGDFGKIDDTQKNMLSQMYDRAKGMNDDVEKYLTIAKIDQGGLQYNLEKLDISDFAKNITEQQKLAVEKRKLTISFETDGQSSYFVSGDKVQLKQVFQNLIDNAMKFTKEGWIKVKLYKVEGGKKIRVAISDSGVGIKPEIMPTLFKEFARGDGAKVDVGGSGIGIYLAKEIIEKGHKGKIWAESEGAGKGSTFTFELPLYSENKV